MKALEENPRVVFHHHCHRMDIESEPNLILEKRLEYKLHLCWLEFHSVVQKIILKRKLHSTKILSGNLLVVLTRVEVM